MNNKMDPSVTCDLLLSHVKKSNLNYNLSESPFSVTINIKKTFIKEKNGALRFPLLSEVPHQISPMKIENETLLAENSSHKAIVAQYEAEKEAFKHAIHELDLKLQEAKAQVSNLFYENNQLEKKKEVLEKDVKDKNSEIAKLEDISNILKEEKEKFKNEAHQKSKVLKSKEKEVHNLSIKTENLSENLIKIKTEKSDLIREKNKVIKEHSKLEKKLKKAPQTSDKSTNTSLCSYSNVSTNTTQDYSNTFTTCSPTTPFSALNTFTGNISQSPNPVPTPTSSPITSAIESSDAFSSKVIPKFFTARGFSSTLSSQAQSEPAPATTCSHLPQCTVREPLPPPFPSITHLVNYTSKYHLHMMTKSPDEFEGCSQCFSVDNENYGCDKCTWLKWWFKWHGDRHRFPDISPRIYKQYL